MLLRQGIAGQDQKVMGACLERCTSSFCLPFTMLAGIEDPSSVIFALEPVNCRTHSLTMLIQNSSLFLSCGCWVLYVSEEKVTTADFGTRKVGSLLQLYLTFGTGLKQEL